MKRILSLIIAIAMFACLFTVAASAEGTTFHASLDAITGKVSASPDENGVIHANCTIEAGNDVGLLGWVVTTPGFTKLQSSIDDGAWTDLVGQYRARADVISYLSGQGINYDATLNPNAGFGIDNDHIKIAGVSDLAVGEYNIKVRTVNNDSTNTTIMNINLTVVEEVYIPDPTDFVLDTNATQYKYFTNTNGDPLNFLNQEIGVLFEIPEGQAATQFVFQASPTWGNSAGTGSDCLVSIYEWDTDYATTVAGYKLREVQIYGHKDNLDLIIQFNGKVPSGKFLMVINANGANSIGCWAGSDGTTTTFKDGKESTYTPAFYAMLVASDTTFHGASFDSFYSYTINPQGGDDICTLNFGKADGDASGKLDEINRTIDGSDGSFTELYLRGWIGFEAELEDVGYQIGNNAPVFENSLYTWSEAESADKNAVQAASNGGANARRFGVHIPVADLEGSNEIVLVAIVDGKIVKLDKYLPTVGQATPPNTSFTFVGPAPVVPATADASLVIFVLAACAIALVVLKKKAF